MVSYTLKVIGLGLGIATLVLDLMDKTTTETLLELLAIGVISLALGTFFKS